MLKGSSILLHSEVNFKQLSTLKLQIFTLKWIQFEQSFAWGQCILK